MGFALFDKASEGEYVIQSCEPLVKACLYHWTAAISLSLSIYSILTLGSSHIVWPSNGQSWLSYNSSASWGLHLQDLHNGMFCPASGETFTHSSIKYACSQQEQDVTGIDKVLASQSIINLGESIWIFEENKSNSNAICIYKLYPNRDKTRFISGNYGHAKPRCRKMTAGKP